MTATTDPRTGGESGLGLEARAILISTYTSHTDAGKTICGGGPPMG